MLKIENVEVFRNNIRKRLQSLLTPEIIPTLNESDTDSESKTNIPNKNATNLEKGIFNYSLKEADRRKVLKKWDNFYFIQIYSAHLKSVMTNLNERIIQGINDCIIEPRQVAFMTHQEWCPEKWAELIDTKSKRDENKFVNNSMAASTDTFVCRKCKSRKCTHAAIQIRSSDEPMTIYVTCLDCGNRWKTS
jgi:DNA-directed RNA polymerase subunit M/transcription elongation factor TFIIS